VIVSPTTNVLTELSGESNTGAERAALQLTNQFLTLMLDPFVNGRGYAPGSPGGGGPALGFAPDGALPPDIALAYGAVSTRRRRRRHSTSVGLRGAQLTAAATTPTAMPRSAPTM